MSASLTSRLDGRKKASFLDTLHAAVPPSSRSRFFRLPLAEIAYVRSIVEGYDGLAVVRSPDARRGEIELLSCAPEHPDDDELDALITRLGREVRWVEIARPADWDFADGG